MTMVNIFYSHQGEWPVKIKMVYIKIKFYFLENNIWAIDLPCLLRQTKKYSNFYAMFPYCILPSSIRSSESPQFFSLFKK